MDKEKRLTAIFNYAKKNIPEHVANTTPIGEGTYSLVVENSDKTLTKILFKWAKEKSQKNVDKFYKNEINALRLFAANPIEGIETPTLIGEPEQINHKNYFAKYRMTRVNGHTDTVNLKEDGIKQLIKNKGLALAKFHKVASLIEPLTKTPAYYNINGEKINQIRFIKQLPFNYISNKALTKADRYLQAHKREGVIHGDYYDRNILINGDNVTGLIDFGFTGKSENIFADFCGINPEHMPDFICGYEQESGEIIDPYAVAASILAVKTNALNRESFFNPIQRINTIKTINKQLSIMAPAL